MGHIEGAVDEVGADESGHAGDEVSFAGLLVTRVPNLWSNPAL